jgi:protein involved in plasmid replication-relaxation
MEATGVRPDRLRPVTPLTARDRALLAQLAEHEPLATSELRLLFFTGPRTCRQRLMQLERAELLLRVYPAAGRRGTGEALWFLTAKARLLLSAPARRTPSLSLPDLEHRRAVARFFCALVDRSLQHPGEGLWCWHGEARAEHGIGGRIRPDGYGRYLLPDGEVSFYLELDRSTEPGKRVGAKLAGYVGALATVDGRERANILLVCHSQRRLRNLAAHAPTGPPWIWGTTDSERFQLLPAVTEARRFEELPLWSRDPARSVSGCLGRRWQSWGHRQWHSQRAPSRAAATRSARRDGDRAR